MVGGSICTFAIRLQNTLIEMGIGEKDAGTFVTIALVTLAQLLTGIGEFEVIDQNAGEGVIEPIPGIAETKVNPAIEYKKEGPVLGVGANMFKVAGPVLVCGISAGIAVGIILWLIENF